MKTLLAALFAFIVIIASVLFFSSSPADAHSFDKAWEVLKATDPTIMEHSSGMLVKILKRGTGDKSPRVNDRVKSHYSGWLLNMDGTDGKLFDSSVNRGQPFVSAPSGVIQGWKTILQEMREGDKVKIWLPSIMGYGSSGAGNVIPPNAALVFEMELIEVLSGGKTAQEARDAFKAATGKDFDQE
jgi:FKBP-type peptidyl-prolyl cis-trans isomerase